MKALSTWSNRPGGIKAMGTNDPFNAIANCLFMKQRHRMAFFLEVGNNIPQIGLNASFKTQTRRSNENPHC